MFISKQYPENLAFFILRILELFTREAYKFLTLLCLTIVGEWGDGRGGGLNRMHQGGNYQDFLK